MFMAGLETKLSSLKEYRRDITTIALFNGLIPLAAGIIIGLVFNYPLFTSLLLGVIFISSSIAVVVPSLEAAGLFQTRVGKSIVGAAIIEDILSLILLSIVFLPDSERRNLPASSFLLLYCRHCHRFLKVGHCQTQSLHHRLPSP